MADWVVAEAEPAWGVEVVEAVAVAHCSDGGQESLVRAALSGYC